MVYQDGIALSHYIDQFGKAGIGFDHSYIMKNNLKAWDNKPVLCSTRQAMLGPNMRVYPCPVNLINDTNSVLLDEYDFSNVDKYIECNHYPSCEGFCVYNKISYLE
jgi:sulfatase maturation enzyme AslB (radical SAM superfamily)